MPAPDDEVEDLFMMDLAEEAVAAADAPVHKEACESCAAPLTWVSEAYTCSFNCTFCSECTQDMAFVCPNCGGQLSKRAANTQPIGNRKK